MRTVPKFVNGDRTDILQNKSHYNKKGKSNDGYSHTHPQVKNIDKKGSVHISHSDNTHKPTYSEIKNIENENAKRIYK